MQKMIKGMINQGEGKNMVPTEYKNETCKIGPELPGILVIFFPILGDNNSDE